MTNPPTDDRREAFEKWVRKNTEYDLERRDDGQYMFGGAYDLWLGWQAALSHHGEVVPDGWEIDGSGHSITIRCKDGRKAVLRNDIGFTYTDRIVYDFLTALISKAEKAP